MPAWGRRPPSPAAHLLPDPPVATFDAEPLIDQRARRPIARLEDGVTTELTWPTIRVRGRQGPGRAPTSSTSPVPSRTSCGRPSSGPWSGWSAALGVRTVVGLGAFPAPTPHTRPVRLASTVPPESADLAGRVGTVHGTLEVPAGVQAALEVALGQAGVPVIGLWARVPHYVSAMPYPEASAALIDGLCAVTGLVLDSSSLRTGRGRVTAPGRRADRGQPRAPGDGPPAGVGPRLRRGGRSGAGHRTSPAGTRSPPSWSSSSGAKGTDRCRRQSG